jgi:multidrug efflux system membrane fusion protein
MKRTLLLLVLCACGAKKDAPARALTAVKVRQLEKAKGAQASRYSASINAASRVELSFRTGGYVESIAEVKGEDGKPRPIQEGDRVSSGTDLARIRIKDFEQKVAEAKAALADANAAQAQAQRDFTRANKLFSSGSISRAELDVSRARAQSASARVQGAKARVAEAATAMGDASLTTPIDGVVLRKAIEPGQLAAPGVPVFSIADTARVKVLFGVADTELGKLKVGAEQTVTTEAFKGKEFKGRISRIAASADMKSHIFEVEVTIPNPDDELKVGMVAALNLPSTPGEASTPLVPLTAVVRSPSKRDGFAVFVLDDKAAAPTVHVREVELGGFVGNSIPVKAGLTEGEQVVVLGATLLSDGQPVQVIP